MYSAGNEKKNIDGHTAAALFESPGQGATLKPNKRKKVCEKKCHNIDSYRNLNTPIDLFFFLAFLRV